MYSYSLLSSKVTQYKKSAESKQAQGRRRYVFHFENICFCKYPLIMNITGTIASSRALEVSPSPSWGRRRRPPRSWCSGWSAPSASGRTRFLRVKLANILIVHSQMLPRCPSRGPSTSSWEVKRRGRARWSSSRTQSLCLCLWTWSIYLPVTSSSLWCSVTLKLTLLWSQLSDNPTQGSLNHPMVSDQSLAQEQHGQVQEPHRPQSGECHCEYSLCALIFPVIAYHNFVPWYLLTSDFSDQEEPSWWNQEAFHQEAHEHEGWVHKS